MRCRYRVVLRGQKIEMCENDTVITWVEVRQLLEGWMGLVENVFDTADNDAKSGSASAG